MPQTNGCWGAVASMAPFIALLDQAFSKLANKSLYIMERAVRQVLTDFIVKTAFFLLGDDAFAVSPLESPPRRQAVFASHHTYRSSCAAVSGDACAGEARITEGFNLHAKHVIHTVGPVFVDDETSQPLLDSAYRCAAKLVPRSHTPPRCSPRRLQPPLQPICTHLPAIRGPVEANAHSVNDCEALGTHQAGVCRHLHHLPLRDPTVCAHNSSAAYCETSPKLLRSCRHESGMSPVWSLEWTHLSPFCISAGAVLIVHRDVI